MISHGWTGIDYKYPSAYSIWCTVYGQDQNLQLQTLCLCGCIDLLLKNTCVHSSDCYNIENIIAREHIPKKYLNLRFLSHSTTDNKGVGSLKMHWWKSCHFTFRTLSTA